MASSVFPFRMMLFQAMLLVVAIAVETPVLQRSLQISPNLSVQYAAITNLLSTLSGWFVFFAVQPVLPPSVTRQLISFIFFDQFIFGQNRDSIYLWLIVAAFFMFFGALTIKIQTYDALQFIREEKPPDESFEEAAYRYRRPPLQLLPFSMAKRRTTAFLRANALSFSVISLLLLLRSFVLAD